MTSSVSMSNKRKTHHEGERKKRKEHEEIKKSKGVSEVLERAMNHGDIPGRVSEDAAVWSLINRQCFFQQWPGQSPAGAPLGNSNGRQILFTAIDRQKVRWLLKRRRQRLADVGLLLKIVCFYYLCVNKFISGLIWGKKYMKENAHHII